MALLTRSQLKAGIALLFFLNFLYLFIYFSDHPIPVSVHFNFHRDDDSAAANTNNLTSSSSEIRLSTRTGIRRHLPLSTTTTTATASSTSSKPWPILPSFLPWTLDSLSVGGGGPKVGSCEAYFGNGFTRTVDLLPRPPPLKSSSSSSSSSDRGGGGWLRCRYSETLRSSVCEAGKVRMVPDRIRMSKGGERIGEVLGRDEEDELPAFELGAFQVAAGDGSRKMRRKLATKEFLNEFVPTGGVMRHTMRQLVDSFEVVGDSEFQCSEWVEEPTLLLTRYEYANVFHTHTDWYSAYVSSRVTGLPRRPHVVFVDGHCQTKLEETWEALFSSVRFAKNFTGSVCFQHAVIVPLGYETALFKGLSETIDCQGTSARYLWANPDDSKTARLSEFGEMIKAAFGFPVERQRNAEPISGNLNILFVRREDYLAHPRHGGRIQSRLSNEQEVFDHLKAWASSNSSACKVNLINGLFAHMPMKEQIQAIQDASIIVGAHGAGLTHMVSALPKTVILEIISSEFMRPHFRLIAQWKGLQYHAINLHGSSAEPKEVVDRLIGIVKAFRCSTV